MFKGFLRAGVLAVAACPAGAAFAASEVAAFGETLDKAQEAAFRAAERAAASKDTCIGGAGTCKKQDDGIYKCTVWVADHKGSCNKDASDLQKIKKLFK